MLYLAISLILDAVKGKLAALLPGTYKIARALEPGNPELKMLQVWNRTVRSLGENPFGPTKVILGTDDAVVGMGGLAEWEGDQVLTTALGHSQLVKVENLGEATESNVLDVLKGALNG